MSSRSFSRPFERMARSAVNLQQSNKARNILNEMGNAEISERSKKEFSDQLNMFLSQGSRSGIDVNKIGAEFEKARSGTDPKYKARLATQQVFNTLVESPDARRLRGQILQFGSSLRK